MNEVRRETVKLGIDLRPIPVDVGDGIEWEFISDPDPAQWSTLVTALNAFAGLDESSFDPETFKRALGNLVEATASALSSEEQKSRWIEKSYGLGPQRAIAQALIEQWTGFPTRQPSPSGKESNQTG